MKVTVQWSAGPGEKIDQEFGLPKKGQTLPLISAGKNFKGEVVSAKRTKRTVDLTLRVKAGNRKDLPGLDLSDLAK